MVLNQRYDENTNHVFCVDAIFIVRHDLDKGKNSMFFI